jgi:hypothetical protein
MSDRLAHLIARTARESATARRLVFQLLVQQLTTDEARRLNQAAWTGSVDSLRKPTEGLGESSGPRAGARSIIHRPSDNAPREHRVGFDAEYDARKRTRSTTPRDCGDDTNGNARPFHRYDERSQRRQARLAHQSH